MHHRVNSTSLTWTPKVYKPRDIADYRPISLSTFASKMVSKILATHFSLVLPLAINEEQCGFVKGRSTHESIALAQEMVADLDRRSDGGNIIFKYDMSKAYARVEWRFLLCVQDLVYRNICSI